MSEKKFLEENKIIEYLDKDGKYFLNYHKVDTHNSAEKICILSDKNNILGINICMYGESNIYKFESEYGKAHIHLEINGKEVELYLTDNFPYLNYKAGNINIITKEIFDYLQDWFKKESKNSNDNNLNNLKYY